MFRLPWQLPGGKAARGGAAARRSGDGTRRPAGRALPVGLSTGEDMMADERWLIAGLGNPGPRYAGNRHNAGFAVADLLAERIGGRFKRTRFRAEAITGRVAGHSVVLVKPTPFMNLSGGPVAGLAGYYKVPASRVIVVHDELDVPFGAIRLKLGGGDNGHNGLRSVTAALGTRDYYRVRLGIGRPHGRMDPADFVLTDFSATERKELPELAERAADAVQRLVADGLAAAQNEFHVPS